MVANYSQWVERWQAALTACERMGGDARPLQVAPPATPDEVAAAEAALGVTLPLSFRAALLEFSARVEMNWSLPDNQKPPVEFTDVSYCENSWGLPQLLDSEALRRNWIEGVYTNLNDPYDLIWHNKLGFSSVGNGDVLAFDLSVTDDAPVVYLSHDGGEGHGHRLGDSFADFTERGSLLGCPGNDLWAMMPFLPNAMSGLDPHGENAQKWRQWFGLHV